MVNQTEVDEQLKAIGVSFDLWGSEDARELKQVLLPDEHITHAINGYYDGGFAILCVTNLRVLVVDKKPFSLTVEDLRYDMIAEVDYNHRIVTANMQIVTPLRTILFTTWAFRRLRDSSQYIQKRLLDMRSDPRFWEHQVTATGSLEPPLESLPVSPSDVRSSIDRPIYQSSFAPPEPQASLLHTANPFVKVPTLARRRRFPSYYL